MRAAKLLVAGLSVAAFGTLLHIIGMATPHWIEISETDANVGLFEGCYDDTCRELTHLRSQDRAVQAMAILAVLAAGGGVGIGVIFAFLVIRGDSPMKIIRLASGFMCVAASGFVVICITVYGAKIYNDLKLDVSDEIKLGYSFGLTTLAGVFLFVGGLLILGGQGYEEESYIM